MRPTDPVALRRADSSYEGYERQRVGITTALAAIEAAGGHAEPNFGMVMASQLAQITVGDKWRGGNDSTKATEGIISKLKDLPRLKTVIVAGKAVSLVNQAGSKTK